MPPPPPTRRPRRALRTAVWALGASSLAGGAHAAEFTQLPPPLGNGNPTIAWTGSVGGNGVFGWTLENAATGALLDSGGGTSATIVRGSGVYLFTVVEGSDGISPEPPPIVVAFEIDKTPPTISRRFVSTATGATVTPSASGWFVTEVVARYTCSPDVTCPADDGPYLHGTDTTAPERQVVDAAGNPAAVGAVAVRIDTQPPALYFGTPLPSGALDGPADWIWTGTALRTGPGTETIQLGPGSAFTFTPGCAVERETSGIVAGQCRVIMDKAGNRVTLTPAVGPTGTGVPVTDAVPMTRDATQLGARIISYNATDVAGNNNVKRVRYNVADTVAPTKPATTEPAELTNSRRPTFGWLASVETGSGLTPYEVIIDGQVKFRVNAVAQGGAERASYAEVPPADVPDLTTGLHTWSVRAIDGAGNRTMSDTVTFRVDTSAPSAPLVSGPSGLIATRTPVFQASGLPDATFGWTLERLSDGNATPVQSGGPSPSGTVAPTPLEDAQYRLRVRQYNVLGTEGAAATVLFTVDATPPGAPAGLQGGGTGAETQPTFSWAAGEPSAVYRWHVLGAAGDIRLGPGTTTSTSLRLPAPLPPGTYAFRVSQVDPAGNVGPAADAAFTIVPPPPAPAVPGTGTTSATPTRTASSKIVIATINAKRSRPRPGATVTTLAPRLSWPRHAGATVYNVQVYRVQGSRFKKVLKAFPRGTSYVVPAKSLRKGQRYLWRVWPYLGSRKRYTATAKAQSWFQVSPKATAPKVRAPKAKVRPRR